MVVDVIGHEDVMVIAVIVAVVITADAVVIVEIDVVVITYFVVLVIVVVAVVVDLTVILSSIIKRPGQGRDCFTDIKYHFISFLSFIISGKHG